MRSGCRWIKFISRSLRNIVRQLHLEDVEGVQDLLDDEQGDRDDGDDDGIRAEQPSPPPLLALVDAVGESVKGRHGHLRVEAAERVEDGVAVVPYVGQFLAPEVSAEERSSSLQGHLPSSRNFEPT